MQSWAAELGCSPRLWPPSVSPWYPYCAEGAQPSLSQCPVPVPAHSLSLLLDHFLGQGHEQCWILGYGTHSCSQGLYLYTLAQGQAPICPEGALEELIVGRPKADRCQTTQERHSDPQLPGQPSQMQAVLCGQAQLRQAAPQS